MRQYQVPQFITVEDKVFGPFTIKQFLYLAAGGVLIFGARFLLAPFLFWPIAALLGGLAGSLAFLKINEQPFPLVFKNMIFYLLRPRLYVWKKEELPRTLAKSEAKPAGSLVVNIPKITRSKLSDLAWSLDIKEKAKG
jgi:hypothetical protein